MYVRSGSLLVVCLGIWTLPLPGCTQGGGSDGASSEDGSAGPETGADGAPWSGDAAEPRDGAPPGEGGGSGGPDGQAPAHDGGSSSSSGGHDDGGATVTPDGSAASEDGAADAPTDSSSGATYRNPLAQPFASTSIWNTPIGSGAAYVPAAIVTPTASTLQGDQDIIVLTPTAPSTPIYENSAAWQSTVSRCPYDEGPLFYDVPVPSDFVVGDSPVSDTPNNSFAALLADGRTLRQNQPFTRCTAGDPATTYNTFPDVDLYGDGITGAHGGSGLSAIGGTLRVGELRPGGPAPAHALKLELFAAQNYYNDGNQVDCYRWPATTCDGYFDDGSSSLKYGGANPALRPGSLLALPASLAISSLGLTTQPAQLLAWTLQNYGAYLVDDSAWSSVSICVENGPAGVFEDQFQSDWGFALNTNGTTSAFAKDFATILANLSVVNDNGPSSIGGGGTPLQPIAAPLPPPPGDD